MSPPSWISLPPRTPSHHSRLSESTGSSSLHLKFPLAIYFTYGNRYVSMLLSQFVPPSSSPTVSASLFSMSVSSIAALQIGSSVPSFQIPYVCINMWYLMRHSLGSQKENGSLHLSNRAWCPHWIVCVHTVHIYLCLCLCAQSCPILCNPMDCRPPGSSKHGIIQASILTWVAIPFSRGSSQSGAWTQISCHPLPTEPPGKPINMYTYTYIQWTPINIHPHLKAAGCFLMPHNPLPCFPPGFSFFISLHFITGFEGYS